MNWNHDALLDQGAAPTSYTQRDMENMAQRTKAAEQHPTRFLVQKATVCHLQGKNAWNSSCVLPIALQTWEKRRFLFVLLQELFSWLSSSFTCPKWGCTWTAVKGRLILHAASDREILGHKGHRKSIIIIIVSSVVITHMEERKLWYIWCGSKETEAITDILISAQYLAEILPRLSLSVGRNYNALWIIDEVLFWWCKLVLMQKIILIVCINGIFSAERNPN